MYILQLEDELGDQENVVAISPLVAKILKSGLKLGEWLIVAMYYCHRWSNDEKKKHNIVKENLKNTFLRKRKSLESLFGE